MDLQVRAHGHRPENQARVVLQVRAHGHLLENQARVADLAGHLLENQARAVDLRGMTVTAAAGHRLENQERVDLAAHGAAAAAGHPGNLEKAAGKL